MDRAWYERVLNACALDVDLANIPDGDAALARLLSGGQKARVVCELLLVVESLSFISSQALARAVYSRKPVVILDDVFAALDATTSTSVFYSLFGQGGLLSAASNDGASSAPTPTVIMSTNQREFPL